MVEGAVEGPNNQATILIRNQTQILKGKGTGSQTKKTITFTKAKTEVQRLRQDTIFLDRVFSKLLERCDTQTI